MSVPAVDRAPESRWRLRHPVLAALALGLLLASTMPVLANHSQTENTRTVAFDHKAGNEWWVEVTLAGPSASSAVKVEAMDTGGAWTNLPKRDWGAYAASFHIEPGHQVRFRATWSDGDVVNSCWFTHPAGVEQCGTPPPPPPPPGAFDAGFTGFRGSEYWVQASVSTNGPAIQSVDVHVYANGAWGPFMPVSKHSWGWGSSYHFPQGSILQMRATATDGQRDLSSCRQWIPPQGQDATIVTCPDATTPPPAAFDATFTGVKGNEWWVQVNVAGNQPISHVVVRVDCASDWRDLAKQSWGGWAASFFIPAGAKVDFQARGTGTAADVSGGYTWPQATPTTGCPQGNWPRQGSTAVYDLWSGVCGGGNCMRTEATMRLMYDNGRWLGACTGRDTDSRVDGTVTTVDWTSTHVGLPPPWLTPRTQVGAEHRPDHFVAHFGSHGCGQSWVSSPITVQRQEDHQTALRDSSGNPITLRSWYAQSSNPDDNLITAHWDVKMGLLSHVDSNPRMSSQGSHYMTLVQTNAPLR